MKITNAPSTSLIAVAVAGPSATTSTPRFPGSPATVPAIEPSPPAFASGISTMSVAVLWNASLPSTIIAFDSSNGSDRRRPDGNVSNPAAEARKRTLYTTGTPAAVRWTGIRSS